MIDNQKSFCVLIMSRLMIIGGSPSPAGRGWGGAKAIGFRCDIINKNS
jgi:hypothetical protein